MLRWMAFDSRTAGTMMTRLEQPGNVEVQQGDALLTALEARESCLLMLPSRLPGKVLLAQIRPVPAAPKLKEEQTRSGEPPLNYEPSGFLGLSDSPISSIESPIHKKSWWNRGKP